MLIEAPDWPKSTTVVNWEATNDRITAIEYSG